MTVHADGETNVDGARVFAGHVGAGMAIGSLERRLNVGLFVAAALALDGLLWLFVLAGWEAVEIPADFTVTRQPAFTFPLSHGLLAALAWSALAGFATLRVLARRSPRALRTAWLVAAAVFSHWVLDALVHRPELPVDGSDSMKVGFGLWNAIDAALVIEGLIVVAGLALFVRGTTLSRGATAGLAVLALAVLALTVVGMKAAPPPPSAFAMAASSLLSLFAVCALALWFGRRRR